MCKPRMASHCPEREIIGHVTFQRPHATRGFSLCAGKKQVVSPVLFVGISRCFSAEPSPGCLLGCIMCELPGGVAGDENGVARTRSRVACTDEEGGTSCRRKNWGDDLFRREKPSRSLSSFFCSRARPSGASVWAYMVVKFPISTVQPNNTVAGEVWQRNNFLSLVVRWKVTCALALVPFVRARAIAGTIPCNLGTSNKWICWTFLHV